MKEQNQPQNFKVIFKELELKNNKEIVTSYKKYKSCCNLI